MLLTAGRTMMLITFLCTMLGPLVTVIGGRYFLIGVVSGGMKDERTNKASMQVFARVTHVLKWIKAHHRRC